MVTDRLGDQLIAAGLLSQADLDVALAAQRTEGGFLVDVLVSAGVIPEQVLLDWLARKLQLRYSTGEALTGPCNRSLHISRPSLARQQNITPLPVKP